MLSFIFDWLIIGVVVYVFGRLVGTPAGSHPVWFFFVMLVFWPLSVISFLVTCAKLVGLLARKHGLR